MKNVLLPKFYRICRKAGIEDEWPDGSVDIHSLRVTYCTMTIGNGADPKSVQDILGHSTLALTMKTYAKATDRPTQTSGHDEWPGVRHSDARCVRSARN